MLAAALAVLVVAGCGRSGGTQPIVLDGRARVPTDEGVMTFVSRQRLVLDGRRTYTIGSSIQSFSTYTLETVPLLERESQYVQIGAAGHRVAWVASIGAVVRAPGQPARVFYIGKLRRVDGARRAVFVDGTVLRLAAGVQPPAASGMLRAEIDPATRTVVALIAA